MLIQKETKKLARIFRRLNATLYLIGGQVRDGIIGIKTSNDIDITSKLRVEEFKDIVIKKGFKIHNLNKNLGSVTVIKNNVKMEYTSFRVESYIKGHSPSKVKLNATMKEDALRRDFTMNAIYYDILKKETVDLLNGINDINRKTIKIVNEKTFNDDGLRLLRLCRFSGELNFKVDGKTIKRAKENIDNIDDISKERIYKELQLINDAKNKHDIGRVYNSYYIMNEIGLIKKLFILDGYKFNKKDLIYFKKDIDDYFSLVFYLIYKTKANIYSNKILKELKADNKTIQRVHDTCTSINQILKGKNLEETIINYKDTLVSANKIVALINKEKAKKCLSRYNHIKNNNLLDKKCVNIDVVDLIEIGVKKNCLSEMIHKLHILVVKDMSKNTKEKLIKEAKRLMKC